MIGNGLGVVNKKFKKNRNATIWFHIWIYIQCQKCTTCVFAYYMYILVESACNVDIQNMDKQL